MREEKIEKQREGREGNYGCNKKKEAAEQNVGLFAQVKKSHFLIILCSKYATITTMFNSVKVLLIIKLILNNKGINFF